MLAPRSPTEETRQRGGPVLRSKSSKETGEKTVSTSRQSAFEGTKISAEISAEIPQRKEPVGARQRKEAVRASETRVTQLLLRGVRDCAWQHPLSPLRERHHKRAAAFYRHAAGMCRR